VYHSNQSYKFKYLKLGKSAICFPEYFIAFLSSLNLSAPLARGQEKILISVLIFISLQTRLTALVIVRRQGEMNNRIETGSEFKGDKTFTKYFR
jgi:hypothetical protein